MSDAAITAFHAHVYYRDTVERERAAVLRDGIEARFTAADGPLA